MCGWLLCDVGMGFDGVCIVSNLEPKKVNGRATKVIVKRTDAEKGSDTNFFMITVPPNVDKHVLRELRKWGIL